LFIAFLIGFLFGFVGSMPVAGPIAALVLARALSARFRAAIAISIGAAVAEAGYAFLAFWGFSTLLVKYPVILPISRAAAAVILVTLGILLAWKQGKIHESTEPQRDHLTGSLLLGFTICALNPTLLATWTAASATLASTGLLEVTPRLAGPFAVAVSLGIISWFFVLLLLVRHFRERFRAETLAKLVRVIGTALVLLGLYFAYLFVRALL
jgi:threonine/homoserine/homoserine lactone efflux protein